MTMRSIADSILVLIVLIALIIGFHYLFVMYEAEQRNRTITVPAPYFHNLGGPAETKFRAGDVMFLHTEVTRTEQCSTEANYRILTESQPEPNHYVRIVWWAFPTTRTVTHPGTYSADVRLELPRWLQPGNYVLDRTFMYECNKVQVRQEKLMPLEIVP